MEYSTFYDESSLDVSGLPDMPSLVRIDREAIQLRTLKIEKLDITEKDNLKTGVSHPAQLEIIIFPFLAITGNSLIFVSCIGDRSLVRFDTETSTGICLINNLTMNYWNVLQLISFWWVSGWTITEICANMVRNWRPMSSWHTLAIRRKELPCLIFCNATSLPSTSKNLLKPTRSNNKKVVYCQVYQNRNFRCLGLCSSNGELFTTVVENDVLFLRIQKTGLVSHIPISCVPREETSDSMVSGICSSDKGIIFISDSGRNQVYRVDTLKKNCTSFGADVLG